MLIYAGIDEAGYGPMFGPLCVASSVIVLDKYNPDYILINNQFSDYKMYNLIRENESIPLHDYLPAILGNRVIHFTDKLDVAYNYLKSNYSIIYNNKQEEVLLFQHN